MSRRVLVTGTCLIALAPPAAAQGVTVRGAAFDSIRGAPLQSAFVSITGNSMTATTDARGRFEFDGIMPGTYTFTLQHAGLDSIGFTGLARRATITDGRAEVKIAVPSFATLWRVTCGTNRVPKDSGFVYGTVRDAASQMPTLGADVEVSWMELGASKAKGITQRLWRGQTRSDERGGYAVCGIPIDVSLRVRAERDSSASGLVDLPAKGARVQRRDLLLGLISDTDSTQRGIINGRLTIPGGAPLGNARVIVDGAPEVRSTPEGRFRAAGVPWGTRQVEVLAIGYMPVVTAVDVTPSDTVWLTAELQKVTTLDVVRVTARPATRRLIEDFDARRRTGSGFIKDSTYFTARGTLTSAFYEIPSVAVQRNGAFSFFVLLPGPFGGRCVANLWIDGREARGVIGDPSSAYEQLDALRPNDIAAIEVYPRLSNTPSQFLSIGPERECGSVVVWTKWAFNK
jgi:hypothetical protein